MSTANESPSPGAIISTTPDRDHAADSDDSLARKKPKLSEEPEVRIEADEPEDVEADTDFQNAIMIDDTGLEGAYSDTFHVHPSSNDFASPLDELKDLQRMVDGTVYLRPGILMNLTIWIEQHLEETQHDKRNWPSKYLESEVYFDQLARWALSILSCGDLIDPSYSVAQVQRLGSRLHEKLTLLCLRMASVIPKLLEEPFARRDSVQPAMAGQQPVPFSGYLTLMSYILEERTPLTQLLHNTFAINAPAHIDRNTRTVLGTSSFLDDLNVLLLNLSLRPREFNNTWQAIADITSILSVSLIKAGQEHHTTEGQAQVDNMLMAVNEYIVPAICQKHPRALPANFHCDLISQVSSVLHTAVTHRPMSSVLELYKTIAGTDNALPRGLLDEDATEAKLDEASCGDRSILAELIKDLWLLQVLKGYVSTDILDIKSKGIVALRDLLKAAHVTYNLTPPGVDHPVLQYLARFLRIGNFTEYIFSADSHASLVTQCSNVIAFLAVTGTYTDHETDLIWQACTTSVEAEFVKASFEVLKAMLIYVGPAHALYMARKYTQTPASALSSYAVNFLSEAFAKFHSSQPTGDLLLEPMRICFDVLKSIDLDPPGPSTEALRVAATSEIMLLIKPQYSIEQRKCLYELCVAEIRDHTKHTTTSIEIFELFLRYPKAEEAELILNLLPVKAAVDELVHFVRSETKQQGAGTHTVTEAVKVRLELVLYLVGLSDRDEDKELEERLWTYAIGDAAVNSQSREEALDAFITTARLTMNPRSVQTLFERCVDQFLPTMSADCATVRLISFLGDKVKQAEKMKTAENLEDILEDQPWQQLVRLATATSTDHVANAGISAICGVLFPQHMSRDDPFVVALQVAFVRRHIDNLQSLQEETDLAKRRTRTNRGITLLETIHRHGNTFKPQASGSVKPIELAGGEESDHIEFTVHIHGPQSGPISRTVKALEDCHISDLGKALQSTSGVVNHDLVREGKLTHLEDISTQTLNEAGIKAASVVSIRPRYTYDCDFGKVFASNSAIEGEILAKFGHLESLLDAPEDVAERVYAFLSQVSPPMSTRHRVLTPDVPLEEIFPQHHTWRTMFSTHILASHLRECNKLGVADKQFILHGAKMLSGLLLDSSRPFRDEVLFKCLPVLVGFLQGGTRRSTSSTGLFGADLDPERPLDSPPPPYLEESKRLGFRLFDLIEEIQQAQPLPSSLSVKPSMRAHLTKQAYAVVLQLARTDGLWPEIEADPRFISTHETLLLNKDPDVSNAMFTVMGDFAKEKRELAAGSYLNTLITLLPNAMTQNRWVGGFFTLFNVVLMATHENGASEAGIRSVIDTLVQHLWQYQHTETPDVAVVDHTLCNLLTVLKCAIGVLRCYKQPLRLGNLAVDICNRLLFSDDTELPTAVELTRDVEFSSKADLALRASGNGNASLDITPVQSTDVPANLSLSGGIAPKPLWNTSSRAICMEIVRSVCDTDDAYGWLMHIVSRAAQRWTHSPGNLFPAGYYMRAPDACAGLSNLGMTCYMNSLLQQVYANLKFRKFIFDTPVNDPSDPDLLWHVKMLFAHMQEALTPYIDTRELARFMRIAVDTQEDVHGYYTTFMTELEKCMPTPAATAAFKRMFSGQLVTQVQGSCGHVSSRPEAFSDLSITVQNKSSLADSLAEFVQGEPMQGANKYQCLSCEEKSGGKLVDAMRRTCLDEVPDHLTVCLKRFTFDMMGQESKNNDYFEFPEEIDLSPYQRKYLEKGEGSAEPDNFKLVGIIVHSGVMTFGHYWSYVRLRYPDPSLSKWVRLEDAMARPAKGFEEVSNECFGGNNRSHNGYVLFYQREDSFANTPAMAMPSSKSVLPGGELPPRVQPPEELFQETHCMNIQMHRTAQPFEDSFHKLVIDIIKGFRSHVPQFTNESTPSPTSEADAGNKDQTVIPQTLPLHTSLANLAFKYLQHVLLSEKALLKVNEFMQVFKEQMVSQPSLARCMIDEICNDPNFFMVSIDHGDVDVRASARSLMRECLVCIRVHDLGGYFDDVLRFVQAHVSQLPNLDFRYERWFDFFLMAWEVKLLGTEETDLVLQAGYVTWILDVAMDVPFHPEEHTDYLVLHEAVKKNRVSYGPLFQFLGVLLNSTSAFNGMKDFIQGNTFTQAQSLVATAGPLDDRLPWMVLALQETVGESNWQNWAPAQLVVHMVSSPDPAFREIISRSLASCLRRERYYLAPQFNMVAAFVSACGDVNVSSHVLNAFVEGAKECQKPPHRAVLEVLEAAFQFAPRAVLNTVRSWACEWLGPESRIPKRTQNWLSAYLFSDQPLNAVDDQRTYGTVLDRIRFRSAVSLFRQCRDYMLHARDVDEPALYPQMLGVLDDALQYLKRLLGQCQLVLTSQQANADDDEETVIDPEMEGATGRNPQTGNGANVYRLSPHMANEYMNVATAVRELEEVLRELNGWDNALQYEEEAESSVFDDTDDEEL